MLEKLESLGIYELEHKAEKILAGLGFKEFEFNLVLALQHIQENHSGDVLMVSSGGPIATLIAYLLGASDSGRIELNLRLRNSAFCELHYSLKRASVISFNSLSHLTPGYEDWITYA